MTAKATRKETENPVSNNKNSFAVKVQPFFIISSPEAAAIVGTANINENSAAVFLSSPKNRPPIMVAAARETPGTMEIV